MLLLRLFIFVAPTIRLFYYDFAIKFKKKSWNIKMIDYSQNEFLHCKNVVMKANLTIQENNAIIILFPKKNESDAELQKR